MLVLKTSAVLVMVQLTVPVLSPMRDDAPVRGRADNAYPDARELGFENVLAMAG